MCYSLISVARVSLDLERSQQSLLECRGEARDVPSGCRARRVPGAGDEVVVDEARGLHERVDGCRPHKGKAPALEGLADRGGLRGLGRHLAVGGVRGRGPKCGQQPDCLLRSKAAGRQGLLAPLPRPRTESTGSTSLPPTHPFGWDPFLGLPANRRGASSHPTPRSLA